MTFILQPTEGHYDDFNKNLRVRLMTVGQNMIKLSKQMID